MRQTPRIIPLLTLIASVALLPFNVMAADPQKHDIRWVSSTPLADLPSAHMAENPGHGFDAWIAAGMKSSPAWEWLIETIYSPGEVGSIVSAATDPITDETFISYHDETYGDLWLARSDPPTGTGNCGPNDSWGCDLLDSSGVVGKQSSIDVGGSGPQAKLFISYFDESTGSLKVMEGSVDRTTGALTYTIEIIERGDPSNGTHVGTSTAVAVNDLGEAHVLYQVEHPRSEVIKYARRVDPGLGNCGEGAAALGWQCDSIQDGTAIGEYVDLGIYGDHHRPFLVFFDAEQSHTTPVIAWWVGSGGSCNLSDEYSCGAVQNGDDDTGEWLSFAVALDTGTHLAYRNATTGSVEWSRHVGSGGNCGYETWQCEWIDDIGAGAMFSGIDIVTDGNSNPIIVYQDVNGSDYDVKIARPVDALLWGPPGNCGPQVGGSFSWLCETLDLGDLYHAEAVGGLSVALNAAGEATVAYREFFDDQVGTTEGRLKVATEPRIVLFADGFESGDTGEWSTTVP